MRLKAFLILALAVLPAWAGAASVASAQAPKRPAIDIIEIPGVLDPSYVNYIRDEISDSNRRNTALILLQVSSGGALDVDLHALLHQINGSSVPVAVWIGPRGARAESGAALMVAAAHIAGMTPDATLGPIHPFKLTEPPSQEVRDAETHYFTEFAGGRLAPAYHDRALTAQQALDAGVAAFVTPGLAEFFTKIDGQAITTGSGPVTLRIKSDEVDVRFHKPGPIRRFLHAMTSPSLVYILLIVGAGLIVFEIFQPGFGVAGVTGGAMLAAAGYGLFVLPLAWWALAALIIGVVLLTIDVWIHGLGPPTIAGTILLFLGSWKLFAVDAVRVPLWLVVLGVVSALVFFIPVLTTIRRNQRPTGRGATRALVGEHGEVRSVLNPEGFVWVSGALWRARSDDGSKMRVGEPVRVTNVAGELLTVSRSV